MYSDVYTQIFCVIFLGGFDYSLFIAGSFCRHDALPRGIYNLRRMISIRGEQRSCLQPSAQEITASKSLTWISGGCLFKDTLKKILPAAIPKGKR